MRMMLAVVVKIVSARASQCSRCWPRLCELSWGGPADAHDAGPGCVNCLAEGQLMLMMLAVVV